MALWSNCKRTQSSESRFFLCKKYELLLRSLRSNEADGFATNMGTLPRLERNVKRLHSWWNVRGTLVKIPYLTPPHLGIIPILPPSCLWATERAQRNVDARESELRDGRGGADPVQRGIQTGRRRQLPNRYLRQGRSMEPGDAFVPRYSFLKTGLSGWLSGSYLFPKRHQVNWVRHPGKTLLCRAVTSIFGQRLLHKMKDARQFW